MSQWLPELSADGKDSGGCRTRMSVMVTSAPRSDDSGGKFLLGSACGSFSPCNKQLQDIVTLNLLSHLC